MAKITKDNPYKNLDLKQVKEELVKNAEYLETIDLDSLEDDIEWETDYRGVQSPKINATVEQKLDSYIILVKDSIEQLDEIVRLEAFVSDFIMEQLDILEEHLNIIREYYASRPHSSVTNREHYIEVTNKKGSTYTIKRIAANVPTQIKHSVKTQKIVMGLLPIINNLRENRKEGILLKGGRKMPISLYRKYMP